MVILIKHDYTAVLKSRAENFILDMFNKPPTESNTSVEMLLEIAMAIENGVSWQQHGSTNGENEVLAILNNKTQTVTINDNPNRNTGDKQLLADTGTTDDADPGYCDPSG